MISTHLFHFFEIIYLNIFVKFLSFIYVTSKLNILSNYAKHLKELTLCYMLVPFFIILKSLYPINQPACLKEDKFGLKKKLSYTKKLGF